MSSVRERIVVAAIAALNSPAPPSGVPAAGGARTIPSRQADFPRIDVRWEEDREARVGGKAGPITLHAMILRATCFASGSGSGPSAVRPDSAADPLVVHAVKRLTDNELGGLVDSIAVERSEATYDQLDLPVCRVDVDFLVEFPAKSLDPEKLPNE